MSDQEDDFTASGQEETGNEDGEEEGENKEDGEEGEHEDKEEGEEEDEDKTESEKVPPNPLVETVAGKALSMLCKTGDGLAHAYVKMELPNKKLTDIESIQKFIHVRFLNLSNNQLTDLSALSGLTHLLVLDVTKNSLKSAKCGPFTYLQVASFADNLITSVADISHPLLENLNLAGNKLNRVEGLGSGQMTRLTTLNVKNNQITSLEGLVNMPNLKTLHADDNQLTALHGVDNLPGLVELSVKNNQIDNLGGTAPANGLLQFIDLYGNQIADVTQTGRLKHLTSLKALIMMENPCNEDAEYRMEVLVKLRQIEKLDDEEYSDEDRQEAEEIEAKRREEEAEAAAAEEEQETNAIDLPKNPQSLTRALQTKFSS